MKQVISIEIECGELTCASARFNFCRFFGKTRFGQTSVCLLFRDKTGNEIELQQNEIDFSLRCQQCLSQGKQA